jgi:hypothetical protein
MYWGKFGASVSIGILHKFFKREGKGTFKV